ncbi:MAG: bifunctional diaminohydroxyphosphoribosylaminopyrimidine deaminase/5-amino-6-(5-phosphoribosylamino)uracil reductase RibD [Pseudomonadales bacterium]
MISESDLLYLRGTVELAEQGLFSCAPNPRVGCIIVRDGRVLGRGAHLRTGGSHAEVVALADAGGDAAGATVYVSLEPCAHHGRTPPCVDALIRANVRRVVAAMRDPYARVAGEGFRRLREAGIVTEVRELPEALALNAGYRSRIRWGRPWVRLKVAASLDGRTAMASGESRWITGSAARADVQYWRARSCAVITGSGTVLADDPALTVREPGFAVEGVLRQPLRVILDSQRRVGASAAVFREPGEALVVHGGNVSQDAVASPGIEYFHCGADSIDLPELLDALGARGMNEVLVEAGPRLIGSFLAEGLWDEILLYMAPKFLGSSARPIALLPIDRLADSVEATIRDCVQVGADLRLTLVPARED